MYVPADLHPDDTAARAQLALRLRRIREGRHISQHALADRIGLESSNFATIERRRSWKVSTVQPWARALGYRLDLRLDGLDVPDDSEPLAAIYNAQQPTTEADEDQLDLRILVNNLARIRRAEGMSFAALGARLGCGEAAVYRRESRPDGLLVATAQRFSRALGGCLRLNLEPVWSDIQTPERTAV